jgi:hypothetical protein
MEFLINESQLRTILMEQDESKMTEYMKILYSFTKNITNRVSKIYGINLKMLLTWGTSVGGLVMPLDHFIKTGNFDLSDDERCLILVGVALIVFFEYKKDLSGILSQFKKEGIEDTFKIVLEKAKDLKSSFKRFLSSLNVTSTSFMETIAYSFLIPIILDIQNVAYNSSNAKEAAILIAERLIASGVVVVGSQVLSQVIRKIIERIK